MKIFISWSGERSEAMARALHEWFPLVLHYVIPWLSQSDINAGERWSLKVAKELEECNFGVMCITRENLVAPWILFEAGALAKSMQDGRVIPMLLDLDLKELSGPLAQFQGKKSDKAGIKELIFNLNNLAPNPVPEAQLETLFEVLWIRLESKIGQIPKNAAVAKKTRPQEEILEELVAGVRNVEMRVRDSGEDFGRSRRRRSKMFPEVIHDFMYKSNKSPGDPLRYVIVFSLVKDDFPWIFELAMEAYRAHRTGNRQKIHTTKTDLANAVQMLRRGPFMEMMFEDKSGHLLYREIERMLDMEFDTEDPIFARAVDEPSDLNLKKQNQ